MTKLVYILAASHSGSTLLTMLLNSHPEAATIGELSPGHMEDISKYLCSCGCPILKCEFWKYITSAMRKCGIEFNMENFGTQFSLPDSHIATKLLKPLHRGPALELLRDMGLHLLTNWPSKVSEIMQTNSNLISAILDYYHANVFIDKGNRALRLKFLLSNPSFDIKVIRLIRDGRAVALTYMDPAGFADAQDKKKRGGGTGEQREKERLDMKQAAYQWRRCNEEAEHILARLDKSPWIEIQYEQLCKDTDKTLDRIFDFIGLDPEKKIKDFRSIEHHVVGNGMRLDTTSEVHLDERWRKELTEQDIKIFESTAGKMNRKYEYE